MTRDFAPETTQLAAQFGLPHHHVAVLPSTHFEPVNMTDRIGEVCMVIRRPNGNLLSAIKTTYPPGTHRLLTGGVHPDEPIFTALLRETAEETALTVAVRRFLAVVEYRSTQTTQPVFYTWAFLLDELGGTLRCDDPTEKHGGFFEIASNDLPARATALEQLSVGFAGSGCEDWVAWGSFRAIIHRVVWQCLAADARK